MSRKARRRDRDKRSRRTHKGSRRTESLSPRRRSRSRLSEEIPSRSRSRDRRSEERTSRSLGNGTSASGESEIAKLTLVLTDAIKAGSMQSKHYANERVIPEFDPEIRDLTVVEWLRKIDEFAQAFIWDETDKVFFAAVKLRGIARDWYDGLKSSPMSWPEFSGAITLQFSWEENFGKLLEVATLYKSAQGQSLQSYCFEKIKRLNKLHLDIPEEKIVEFVVHGIQDDRIRMSLTTAKMKTIPELTRSLESLTVEAANKPKELKEKKRSIGQERTGDKSKRSESDNCFRCGKSGHKKFSCPELVNKAIKGKNKKPKGIHLARKEKNTASGTTKVF